ncbi:hypothetical protein [Pseudomonas sp. TH31]|uniref:hypothetical protein n=1 Tax=Pseudomonas sp. TH31 TaxID=2796396 RepID=UPI0019117DD0|nr:hypothetical protein [Pseudomonas sp. TH31]MBK5416707.1 hypothetical protein [Pseudomonas sp. TH31]
MSELFQPDAAHLQRLKDIEESFYRDRTQCNIQGRELMGLMETFEVQGLQQALDKYTELLGQGYTPSAAVMHRPVLTAGPTFDWVVLTLQKPAEQVEAELAKIMVDVETNYLEQLVQAKAAAVAKEVESLLAAERRKQQQTQLDAKAAEDAAEYARVEADVLRALGGSND